MKKRIKKSRHKYSLREQLDNTVKDDDALRWSLNQRLLTAFPDRVKRLDYICDLIKALDELIEEAK